MQQAREGDLNAFSRLVREYEHRIYGLCLRLLKHPEDAKDAAQETFLKVFRRIGDFRGESGFSTWLYRITVNTCTDFARKRKRETGRKAVLNDEHETWTERLPDREPLPEAVVVREDMKRALLRAIDSLPDKYRIPLVLHVQQGLSYQETAEVLGLSVQTTATRIHRAKEKLRKHPVFAMEGGSVI